MQQTVRRTKRTLHLVVGMYVAIGLVVSGAGAMTGDRVDAFLGFVIVGGALGPPRCSARYLMRWAGWGCSIKPSATCEHPWPVSKGW